MISAKLGGSEAIDRLLRMKSRAFFMLLTAIILGNINTSAQGIGKSLKGDFLQES